MLRRYLPSFLRNELFGFREQYGRRPEEADADWQKWLALYPQVYRRTQRRPLVSSLVNEAGYRVLGEVDLRGKQVAEIGAGGGYHLGYFRGVPEMYRVVDVCAEFFEDLAGKCEESGVRASFHQVAPYAASLPWPTDSQDILLSFCSLEHLYPLAQWLDELFRVLRPGGELVGAIPGEGGVAWGLGRWLTSRRTLKREFGLDIRKIVCWEHPNTCDEILAELRARGALREWRWPLGLLPLDAALIVRFIVRKSH